VRKTAAICVAKLYDISPSIVEVRLRPCSHEGAVVLDVVLVQAPMGSGLVVTAVTANVL
jgi:hypothetical protein